MYSTIFLLSLKTLWIEEALWTFPGPCAFCLLWQLESVPSFLLDSGSRTCGHGPRGGAKTQWSVHLEHFLQWIKNAVFSSRPYITLWFIGLFMYSNSASAHWVPLMCQALVKALDRQLRTNRQCSRSLSWRELSKKQVKNHSSGMWRSLWNVLCWDLQSNTDWPGCYFRWGWFWKVSLRKWYCSWYLHN